MPKFYLFFVWSWNTDLCFSNKIFNYIKTTVVTAVVICVFLGPQATTMIYIQGVKQVWQMNERMNEWMTDCSSDQRLEKSKKRAVLWAAVTVFQDWICHHSLYNPTGNKTMAELMLFLPVELTSQIRRVLFFFVFFDRWYFPNFICAVNIHFHDHSASQSLTLKLC